jgi:hypothetical protein
MLLHLIADIRPTEAWTASHLLAVVVTVVAIAVLVHFIRVRPRR